MALGAELLLRGLGGMYTPQNAVAYNPDTQTFKYADGSTGPTPTKQPSLISRTFSPEAGQVMQENQAYQQAPWLAQQQKTIAENRMRPAAQGLIPNFDSQTPQGQNTALDVLYGAGRTSIDPADVSNFKRSYQDIQNNLGGIQSQEDITGAKAGVSGNMLGGERNVIGLNNIPQEAMNTRLGMENAGLQEWGQNQQLPGENAIQLAQTQAGERNIPLNYGAGGTEDLGAMNNYMTQRFGVPPSELSSKPYVTETTPSGIKLPTGISSTFKPQQLALMNYMAKGGIMNGSMPSATLPGGGALPMRADANIIRPTIGGADTPPISPSSAPPPDLQTSIKHNVIGLPKESTWGVGNSITGYTPPITSPPIAGDEALSHLGFKLDNEGNLQKIDDGTPVDPKALEQAKKIQAMVHSGKMVKNAKSHMMRQLVTHYLSSWPTSGANNPARVYSDPY